MIMLFYKAGITKVVNFNPAISIDALQKKNHGEIDSNSNLPIILKRLWGANCLGIFCTASL